MVAQNFETPRNGMPYQTIGSLMLDFPGHEKATDYYRDLDIERAIATTRYKVGEVTYNREVFTSFVDNVIIVRLTANKQELYHLRLLINLLCSMKSVSREKDLC